eukprot:scaffold7294_cov93-Cylindrotheca_fusiformis.AAC.11
MRFPALFVNHGGGPLPLLGFQPDLAQHMKDVVQTYLPPRTPKAIVVISAHYEADPVEITGAEYPTMLYDYSGFDPKSYEYQYPAPGSPKLAKEIQGLLASNGVESKLNFLRGFDHGVFVPLMLMYPEAKIPVVCVSLHASLDISKNLKIGTALAPLMEDDILILGSGYTFHNMRAFFGPTRKTIQASVEFNKWIKDTILNNSDTKVMIDKLRNWKSAPGALVCHPREEHLLPLFVVAAAAAASGDATTTDGPKAKLVYNTLPSNENGETTTKMTGGISDHAVTGYLFA